MKTITSLLADVSLYIAAIYRRCTVCTLSLRKKFDNSRLLRGYGHSCSLDIPSLWRCSKGGRFYDHLRMCSFQFQRGHEGHFYISAMRSVVASVWHGFCVGRMFQAASDFLWSLGYGKFYKSCFPLWTHANFCRLVGGLDCNESFWHLWRQERLAISKYFLSPQQTPNESGLHMNDCGTNDPIVENGRREADGQRLIHKKCDERGEFCHSPKMFHNHSAEQIQDIASIHLVQMKSWNTFALVTSLIAACLIVPLTQAQTTTTVTQVLKSLDGSLVTSGQVTFELRPSIDSTVTGVSRFVPSIVVCSVNQAPVGASAAVRAANSVTISGLTGHTFIANDVITVSSMTDASFNGTFTIGSITATSITYPQTAGGATSGNGIISALRSTPGPGSCTITMNTALTPAGTSYKICNQPSFITPGSCFNDYAITSSKDLSTTVPTPTSSPAFTFVDLFSAQQISGNKTFTGNTTFNGNLSFGALTLSGNLNGATGTVYCLNSDSGITRQAAASFNMGTCTPGDQSGSLNLRTLTVAKPNRDFVLDGSTYQLNDAGLHSAMADCVTQTQGRVIIPAGVTVTQTTALVVGGAAGASSVRCVLDVEGQLIQNVIGGGVGITVSNGGSIRGNTPLCASYPTPYGISQATTGNVSSVVSVTNIDGSQEFAALDNICIQGAGASGTVSSAMVDWQGVFIPSYMSRVNIDNFHSIGLRLRGSTSAGGLGPFACHDCWINGENVAGARPLVVQTAGSNNPQNITFDGSCAIEHQGEGNILAEFDGLGTPIVGVTMKCYFENHNSVLSGTTVGISLKDVNGFTCENCTDGGLGGADFIKISQSAGGLTRNIQAFGTRNNSIFTNTINDTINTLTDTHTIIPFYGFPTTTDPLLDFGDFQVTHPGAAHIALKFGTVNLLSILAGTYRLGSGMVACMSSAADSENAVCDVGFTRQGAGVLAVSDGGGNANGELRSAKISATYTAAGTIQTAVHMVQDTCTLGTNCGITLVGSAAFTSATTYTCTCHDQTTPLNACGVNQTGGGGLTITGTGTDVIRYQCVGN